jgi:hypothetical protein
VQQWHKNLQIFMGTTMWLWLFWRMKNDGAAFLVRAAPSRCDRGDCQLLLTCLPC